MWVGGWRWCGHACDAVRTDGKGGRRQSDGLCREAPPALPWGLCAAAGPLQHSSVPPARTRRLTGRPARSMRRAAAGHFPNACCDVCARFFHPQPPFLAAVGAFWRYFALAQLGHYMWGKMHPSQELLCATGEPEPDEIFKGAPPAASPGSPAPCCPGPPGLLLAAAWCTFRSPALHASLPDANAGTAAHRLQGPAAATSQTRCVITSQKSPRWAACCAGCGAA
jgi:hypothetical protein